MTQGYSELVPITDIYRQDVRQGVALAALGADVTCIFNCHATPEDANRSTSLVEPRSAAFLEGYTLERDYAPAYENDLVRLNDIRIECGVESSEYITNRNLLLTRIEAESGLPPASPYDFSDCLRAQLRGLIEKDCMVRFADYRPAGRSQASHQMNALISERWGNRMMLVPPMADITKGLGKSLMDTVRHVRDDAVIHKLREKMSCSIVLLEVGRLMANNRSGTLNHTDDGLVKTYLLYGSGHARSLSAEFHARGVRNYHAVELFKSRRWNYLDATDETSDANVNRRAAHQILRGLIAEFAPEESFAEVSDTAFDAVVRMTAEREKALQFMIRCAQAYRAEDENDAFAQYLAIMRDVMPNPSDYC